MLHDYLLLTVDYFQLFSPVQECVVLLKRLKRSSPDTPPDSQPRDCYVLLKNLRRHSPPRAKVRVPLKFWSGEDEASDQEVFDLSLSDDSFGDPSVKPGQLTSSDEDDSDLGVLAATPRSPVPLKVLHFLY